MTDSPLPGYFNAKSEHCVFLESRGRKHITLFVSSRASSSRSLPAFREGDVIKGRVDLNLAKPETIKAVTIVLEGATIAVGQEELKFLEIKKTLWAPSATDISPKLSGSQSWPFEIEIPRAVLVSVTLSKVDEKTFKLPPSFSERASTSYIDYRLTATVRRGFLKVDRIISTNIGYRIITIAGPPSPLRQLAYQNSTPILGPEVDSEGWKVLPTAKVAGKLFDGQNVEVECTLAVATPLSYAISTFVPLTLTLSSDNNQLLDLLSKPTAIRVYLVRSLATGTGATEDDIPRRTHNFLTSGAGRAFFWSSGKREYGKRTLLGELEISGDLQPSFMFPRFTIRYTVDLCQFEATGFHCSNTTQRVLASENVVIATHAPPGIRQWSRAPPGYEKPREEDYNNLVGYLENGNQRFWHQEYSS